jgi:hypothetical protein
MHIYVASVHLSRRTHAHSWANGRGGEQVEGKAE